MNECFWMDELPQLGREISYTFSLSREVSMSVLCDAAPMTREISISFMLEGDLRMSRENSKSFGNEEPALAREISFAALAWAASDSVATTLQQDATGGNYETVNADTAFIPTIGGLEPTPVDPALQYLHASAATVEPAQRPGRGAPRPPGAGSRRGLHVKGKPEMQQTARDGAVHWSQQLKQVRAVWAARAARCPDFGARFQAQLDLSLGRVKSKQECLLRTLQLAAADGLIVAAPFAAGGFFGWTRFDVAAGRAGDFRRAVEGLFPAGFREDTVKETFRRAGLVPDRWQWALGWAGEVPWVFIAKDRQ